MKKVKVTSLFRFYSLGVGKRGVVTTGYPDGPLELPARARCAPDVTGSCDGCGRCAEICPTGAITVSEQAIIDLGKCIYCGECARRCPEAIVMGRNCELSSKDRKALEVSHHAKQ